MRIHLAWLAALVAAASASADDPAPLRVLAAASLTEVVQGLTERYEGSGSL